MSNLDTHSASISPSFNADEERDFLRLKSELHERLIAGLNYSAGRSADPAQLHDELRKGATELCRSHAGLLSQVERTALSMAWCTKRSGSVRLSRS